MKFKLSFVDWKKIGESKSIYNTELGVGLSSGDLHSGYVFEAEVEFRDKEILQQIEKYFIMHKQNVENIGKNLYKFQDTLEFRDKDSDKTIKRLDNVEFRALDKSRFAYMVKLPDQSSEVLIFEDCPPNSYLRYFETP